MGVVDLPTPGGRIGPLSTLAPKPMKFVLNWGRRYSLWVFNFGLACCAIEFIATSMSRHDFIRLGVIPFAPGPRQADLMVVSGTVSDKMAPAVKRLYEQMPEPKYVISFGACSNCGGPYWDSYCVTKGVDQIIPVDVYVPGCPPRPEALLHGIIRLQEKIAGERLGDRYSRDRAEPVSPAPAKPPMRASTLLRPLRTEGTSAFPDLGEISAAVEAVPDVATATPRPGAATPGPTATLPPAGEPALDLAAADRPTDELRIVRGPVPPGSGEPAGAAEQTRRDLTPVDSAADDDAFDEESASAVRPLPEGGSIPEFRALAEAPTEELPVISDDAAAPRAASPGRPDRPAGPQRPAWLRRPAPEDDGTYDLSIIPGFGRDRPGDEGGPGREDPGADRREAERGHGDGGDGRDGANDGPDGPDDGPRDRREGRG